MKKIFIFFLFLGSLLANTNSNHLKFTDKEQAWISKNIPITYVYDTDWAPFEWKNEVNRHTGIISDILSIIAKKSNLKFEAIHTNSWATAVLLAQNNKVDMYSAIPYSTDRAKYMNFTSSDIFHYNACFVKRSNDKTSYNNLQEELISKSVAIVKSSSLGNSMKEKYPQANYIEVDKTEDGFKELQNSKIDLFIINSATANYMINTKGYNNLEIAKKLDHVFKLKVAISKSMPEEVLSIVDKTLAHIDKNKIDSIYNKWISPVESAKRINWEIIIYIVIISSVIVLFLIYRQYLLHQTNKQLEELVSFDYITKLYNRRYFIKTCNELLNLVKIDETPSSIIILDVDKFKNINDMYGHMMGDNVLVSIATLLKEHSRKNDVVCRWAGKEFVIFLANTNSSDAFIIAEKIRKIIQSDVINLGNTIKLNYTVSIGVSTVVNEKDIVIEHVIFRADKALLSAKKNGRNNVCVS